MEIVHRWKFPMTKFSNLEVPQLIKQGNSIEGAMRMTKKGFGKRIHYYEHHKKPSPQSIHELILDYYKSAPDLRIVAKLEEVWETVTSKFVPA